VPDNQSKLDDYSADQLLACESVMLELSRILGSYWDDIVLVGGWVPTLLANDADDPHVGTVDIDLALNYLTIPEEAYAQIHELLVGNNFVHSTDKAKQFQYRRTVTVSGVDRAVILDLVTGKYDPSTGKGRRHGKVQDAAPLKAEGVDLVFDRYEVKEIEGELPDKGGKYSTKIKVASVAPIIVMKCAAIRGRLKTKDSYDLYYFIRYYRGGGQAVLDELKPDIRHGLVTKAIAKIREHFESAGHAGPADVAKFLEVTDEDDAAVIRQRVYQTMLAFLEGVDKL
jgi:hypothetical protein